MAFQIKWTVADDTLRTEDPDASAQFGIGGAIRHAIRDPQTQGLAGDLFAHNATSAALGFAATPSAAGFQASTLTHAAIGGAAAQSLNDAAPSGLAGLHGTPFLLTPHVNNAAPVIGGANTTAPIASVVRASVDVAGAEGDQDASGFTALSPDGTKVLFVKEVNTSPPFVTPHFDIQVFLKDLVTGSLTLLGKSSDYAGTFSPDGTKVAFVSAQSDLVAGDTNGGLDIFVRDIASGAVTRVSTDVNGAQANGSSSEIAFSQDGTKIAFFSSASNLVAGDTNNTYDLFVKDLGTGVVTRVSTATDGTQANNLSFGPSFSPDGTKVMFQSRASNLVAGDTNGVSDVFVKDLNTGVLTRVSTDGSGGQTNGGSFVAQSGHLFSLDGTKVLFQSHDTNLAPNNPQGFDQVYMKDLVTGAVTLISKTPGGVTGNGDSAQASFSPDGTRVIFLSTASNLVSGDTNNASDMFVKYLNSGAVVRLFAPGVQGDDTTGTGQYSADASKIAFGSSATNAIASDTNAVGDAFVASLGYVAQGAPIYIAAALTLSDADSANMTGATVTISGGFQAGDMLGTTVAGTGITASFDAGTHVLTLSGTDTVLHYQAVLRQVQFSNPTNATPGASPTRTFTWQADDGAVSNHASNTPTTTINVFDSVNHVHAGQVTVSGTLSQGQTVTADTSGLSDADGLGALHYQWQRYVSFVDSNFDTHTFITNVGADQATYEIVGDDTNARLRVLVTYTDGHGTAEYVTGALSDLVAEHPNNDPTGGVSIDGTPTEGQTLTANTSSLADADGLGDLTIAWLRDGVVLGVYGTTYLLTNADVGHHMSIIVSYVDGFETEELVPSAPTALIANVNDAPTGAVTIGGTVTENQTLTASAAAVADADGLGAFHYQWQRDSGGGFVNVGADQTTYTLGNADVGASIRVTVNYTDLHGTAEHVTSTATAAVVNVNDAPAGGVTISGTATDHQTLTAVTGTIADADGLGAFHYQWQRDLGAGYANVGTDQSTYLLGDNDVGAHMRVVVSYTDGHGTAEALTSAGTATVTNNNHAPTGSVSVSGAATERQVLTANTSALQDADGFGAFHYQWQRDSGTGTAFVNVGTDQATYTLGNADVGNHVRVVVTYTDGGGTAELVTSGATAAIVNVNDTPTGTVTINGTVTEDQTLTANTSGLADLDGLGTFHYQWQRQVGSGFANVGADQATYVLGDADVDAKMRVVVKYTDGHGTAETAISAASAAVANVNDAPVGRTNIIFAPGMMVLASTETITDADGLGPFTYRYGASQSHFTDSPAVAITVAEAPNGVGQAVGFGIQTDYIDGHGHAEEVGSNGLVWLGSSGNDTMVVSSGPSNGLAGAAYGAAGNDLLIGQGTLTYAYYTGNRSDYLVNTVNGTFGAGFTVADQRGGAPDGTDTTASITYFVFADGVYTFDLATAAVTSKGIVDTDLSAPWRTQTTTFDAQGSVASQTIFTDAGTRWLNTYDTTGTASWLWKADAYAPASPFDLGGPLLSEYGVNDDGTRWLTLNDTANIWRWTTATISFDVNGNITGVAGINDDTSNTLTMKDLAGAYDTAQWFNTPYDPNLGGAARDTVLAGGGNADFLQTYAGNDTLSGAGGNDVLTGGTGNDTMTGGAGDDHFVFHAGDGLDVVTDFTAGNSSGDVIELHAMGIANFTALQSLMTQVGADVVITIDVANTITLQHVTLTQLNAGDFLFA